VRIIVELEPDPAARVAADGDLERLTWHRLGVDTELPISWEPDDDFGVRVVSLPADDFDVPQPLDGVREERLAWEHDADLVLERTAAWRDHVLEERFLARGSIPTDGHAEIAREMVRTDPRIRRVFADPAIEPAQLCFDDAGGDVADVEAAIPTALLKAAGLDGFGVRVAVADGGFSLDHLKRQGRSHKIDITASVPMEGMPAPGKQRAGHGTMCAYAVGIAAPAATLVDVPMLRGTGVLQTLLSDGVIALDTLRNGLRNGVFPGPLVVTNSWAIFDPSTDFPVGHEANYSHEPRHTFNLTVQSLVAQGADVVFAAGNCGSPCPQERCHFDGPPTISGANSLAETITVGALGPKGQPVGYSPVGGTMRADKPDVLGYSQFRGSLVNAIDRGTSTACPVVAGVVAAIRTKVDPSVVPPITLRALIRDTAGSHTEGGAWVPGPINTQALLLALGL